MFWKMNSDAKVAVPTTVQDILLLRAGVELNPGPTSSVARCEKRGSGFQTSKMRKFTQKWGHFQKEPLFTSLFQLAEYHVGKMFTCCYGNHCRDIINSVLLATLRVAKWRRSVNKALRWVPYKIVLYIEFEPFAVVKVSTQC